jgi:ADP-heptose:LPS heptosyltransferase
LADVIYPEKIFIVQIGKIGDMVLTTPLFSLLKNNFPLSHITVLASEINHEIIKKNPFIDDIIIFKKNSTAIISLIKNYFKKINIWIDTKFEYSKTSELLVKALQPSLSLGYNSRKKVFDVDLNQYLNDTHAICINTAPMKYFNEKIDLENIRPEIYINEGHESSLNSERKNVLLNISAGDRSRYLESEIWKAIIKELSNKDVDVIITGEKKDKSIIEELLTVTGEVRFIQTNDIFKIVDLIRQVDFVITPDTSVVHIASAFNKAQLVFYHKVEWNYKRFAPLSDRFEAVFSKFENEMKIDEVEMKLKLNKLISGNAGSRTRVQKEDH